MGLVVVAHGLSCSEACGIFPDQGLNPYPLHCKTDSLSFFFFSISKVYLTKSSVRKCTRPNFSHSKMWRGDTWKQLISLGNTVMVHTRPKVSNMMILFPRIHHSTTVLLPMSCHLHTFIRHKIHKRVKSPQYPLDVCHHLISMITSCP